MNNDNKEVMPKKRGRPVGAVDTVPRKKRTDQIMVSDGDNAKMTMHNVKLMNLPSIDHEDRQGIEKRIQEYFNICIEDDVRPGVAGLCLALGISRQTWQAWGVGKYRPYADIIEKTRSTLEAFLEMYMLHGRINPVTAIFLLKNNFGYRDQSEVVLTPNADPLGERKDVESLRQKYLEATYNIGDNTELAKKIDSWRQKYSSELLEDGAPD